MKIPKIKKLNSKGFTHHFLVPVLVVLAVGGVGAKQVFDSKAATAPVPTRYIAKVADANGCWLAGRVWKNGTCLSGAIGSSVPCRTKVGGYQVRVVDGVKRGYCTGAIATTVSDATCVNTFHRVYVRGLGCARRIDQDNTNGARQCVGGGFISLPAGDPYKAYVNYIAETNIDRCVAAKIAPPSVTTTIDQIANPACEGLGRTHTTKGCERVCQVGAGTLLQDTIVTTVHPIASKRYYCSRSVVSSISQNRCAQLHRLWVEAGCTRRPDQKDNANDLTHCIAGYPFYNADSEASSNGTLDVCEKDRATAVAHENAGIVGETTAGSPVVVCKNGQIKQPNGTCACPAGQSMHGNTCAPDVIGSGDVPNCKKTTVVGLRVVCDDDPVVQPPQNPGVVTVDHAMKKSVCDLLGRQWVPSDKASDGVVVPAGCSTQSCNRQAKTLGSKIHSRSGSAYCSGFVTTTISQQTCTANHRIWIAQVSSCAQYPVSKQKDKTVESAKQCVASYSTYVIHTATQGEDECLKPSTVQRLSSIARTAGKPFTYVASLPARGLCQLQRDKMWEDGKCVSKPKPKRQVVLAIGDSITARNVDVKKYGKGWWRYLGDKTGAVIKLSAQGGSGYTRKGKDCHGTNFPERLGDIKKASPTYIIVAGGYNDGGHCENGRFVHSSEAYIKANIADYMTKLAKTADAAGIPRDHIYVFTPWGPNAEQKRSLIEPVIRQNAARIGAVYVHVPSLHSNQSYDGIHPTPAGSKYLYDGLVANSDLLSRL